MNRSVMICGSVGSGKSMVARALADKLRKHGKTVAIKEEGLSAPPGIAEADWVILTKTPPTNNPPQLFFSSAGDLIELIDILTTS